MLVQTKTSPITDPIKAEFTRSVDRISKALASTPEDRVSWSPAPSARTPLEVAVHGALSISGIQSWLSGQPFPFESMDALDAFSRNEEKKYTSRQEAESLLEEKSAAYLEFVDSISEDLLASDFTTGMGTFPMTMALTFAADHLRGHACQIDYIQTIYGDRSTHM